MRILILLFRQFYFVVANDCECEVEPWSNWYGQDVTCGSTQKMRQRVCSTPDGWTLGLTCTSKDENTKSEYKSVELPDCRKSSFINSSILINFFWKVTFYLLIHDSL